MDDLVELLTVAERFQLHDGLVVVPDFSVPDGWKNRSETVTIELPDRKPRAAKASLAVAHFRIPDPAASSDKCWRVVVSLPAMTKEDVPIGSKVDGSCLVEVGDPASLATVDCRCASIGL